MNIKITKEYKSIPIGVSFEIPKFTVITGENGSGKTHLLNAIENNDISVVINQENRLTHISNVEYNGLLSNIASSAAEKSIEGSLGVYYNSFNNAEIRYSEETDVKKRERLIYRDISDQFRETILKIAKKENVLLSQLTMEHLRNNYEIIFSDSYGLFGCDLASIYKSYQIRKRENATNKVLEQEGFKDCPKYLLPKEFEIKYGEAPWDLFNRILKKLRLPYRSNTPMGTVQGEAYELKFIHEDTDVEINSVYFSTGERTLLALVVRLYNHDMIIQKPQLFLLDEPDASLHPSMSKLLIDILRDEIVENMGIPVIMTTHSLATIACAPPESLYKITKENKTLVKCDLDDSVKLLSYGVPNLRVSVEDRRTVFVESLNDVKYYKKIFTILTRDNFFNTIIIFIPPHNRKTPNCDEVKQIAERLHAFGATNIYGLIDWDLKNKSKDNLIVLGLEKRYAIENYIFEPHLLGLCLIRNNIVKPIDMGIDNCNTYVEVAKVLNQDTLQKIVDYVENKIVWENDKEVLTSTLIRGDVLQIRKEYSIMQGHKLEELCVNTWQQLNSIKKNKEDLLKLEIINNVINDYPELLSIDILETFKAIK